MAVKQLTKSEILTSIAGTTELSRKQVASVVDALGDLAKKKLRPALRWPERDRP